MSLSCHPLNTQTGHSGQTDVSLATSSVSHALEVRVFHNRPSVLLLPIRASAAITMSFEFFKMHRMCHHISFAF